ncbi:MAG: class I SAM-dependent methyltransferase [Nitriliruptoraceae bacterium]|nr:class I SAM-dependent methyltransferase [Nitriliruptoraceae bacterium]
MRIGRLPVDARSPQRARRVFATLPARYDLIGSVLSFGQDPRWRRTMVRMALQDEPAVVADIATGTAAVAIELASRGEVRVIGLDQSPAMLAVGRRRVQASGHADDIRLLLGQAERLPFADASVDALTFTYLLRYVDDPAATLRELARVVRPGGRIASLEFHVPPRLGWRLAWRVYTRVGLPVIGGLLGGAGWWRVGAFLGPNIEDHYARHPLAQQLEAWRAAGIEDLEVRVMSLGGGVVIGGRRRG